MRKYIISAILISLFSGLSYSQDYRIGIKIAPTLSNVRTSVTDAGTSVERDGSAVKFLLGAFVDIPFKENYYFHTGVNFASKVTKITAENGLSPMRMEEYDHEYLQVPLLLKLYTNELTLDTRMFFNFGIIPEIRLNTANEEPGNLLVTKFADFDLAGNFGGGVERNIGVNTSIFAALNYNIGFLNTVQEQSSVYNEFTLKSNLFSLDIGIKF
jgi:hypothetical protein